MAWYAVTLPAIRGDQAPDAGVGLDKDRNTPHRSTLKIATFLCRCIFFGRCRQSATCIDGLNGVIDAVILRYARQVPPHHLRDGVLMSGIEFFQLRNGYFEKILVHGGWLGLC